MRLLSYNIHKAIGGRDRRYRPDRVVAGLRRHDPDLACLQEVDRNVDRSLFHDQPELLAEALGSAARVFQQNHPVRTGGYGNLILSRWPVLESHSISLRRGWRKARGAQVALIETPEGPLLLVNWHLGLAERERHWQVERLLTHPLFRPLAHHPTLVVGDTNDWRNRLARGPFARLGFRSATAPPSRFRSFPASLPVASLDKAFYRGPIAVRRARIVKTGLTREASDHLPLLVDFRLVTSGPEAGP